MSEEMTFDVSGLVPEAQDVAISVARVLWSHTRPWFVGLVCFGSAVKGGLIPGASDLDFHLYLEEGAFASAGTLRLEVALALHSDLARIDPAPFRYIDAGAEQGALPEGHIGPVPGAYRLLAGRLPLAEATEEKLQAQARWSLARLTPCPAFVSEGLLHSGEGRGQLAITVRTFCQIVWPVVYQAACLIQGDALAVWRLPKHEALTLLPQNESVGQAVRAFYQSVMTYYPAEASVADALKVIETGVAFLQAMADWASEKGLR